MSGYKMKPFLKWVGGKTQIIDKVISEFPKEFNNYHEIFLGGGSVLFALLENVKKGTIKVHKKINAYDLNESLIYTYKNIQNTPNELYNLIENIIQEFNNVSGDIVNRKPQNLEEAQLSKESYYYWIRNKYNQLSDKKSLLASVYFIFLNKTCFRGLFRVGPNGFNVPYGNYKKPEIVNKEHILKISKLIKDVNFYHCDFQESLKKVSANDFVYLDPPYAQEKNTSFVGYTINGFDLDTHNNLFTICSELKLKNVKFLMSNADVKLVREFFEDEYNIESIICKRSINSKKPDSKAQEVLIKNY